MTHRTLHFVSTVVLAVAAGACVPPVDGTPMDTDDTGTTTGPGTTGTTGSPGECPALLDDVSGLPGTVHFLEDVTSDTVWTAADSPHIVQRNLDVYGGATLTIEPCALVLLDGEDADITVRDGARLEALGTADAPIRFDRGGATRWANVRAEEDGTVRLANVTLRGGGADTVGYDGATLVAEGPVDGPYVENLEVRDVVVEDSAGHGVHMRRYARFAPGSENLTIRGSGMDAPEFPRPLRIDVMAAGSIPTGDYTGNGVDEIDLDPHLEVVQDTTIPDRGVPYYVGRNGGIVVARPVDDDGPVPTLTIEPGVTLRFKPVENTSGIHVGNNATPPRPGSLVAQGTAEAPIVLTSAAPEPAPGDWLGVLLPAGAGAPGAQVVLDYVTIRYAGRDPNIAGYACPSEDGAGNTLDERGSVVIFGWAPSEQFLTNSTIEHGDGWGVFRGWEPMDGPDVDFTPTNTFQNIAYCEQNRIWDMCPNPDVYDCVGSI